MKFKTLHMNESNQLLSQRSMFNPSDAQNAPRQWPVLLILRVYSVARIVLFEIIYTYYGCRIILILLLFCCTVYVKHADRPCYVSGSLLKHFNISSHMF
jgi:hypothetical protein